MDGPRLLDPDVMQRLEHAFLVGSTVNDACLFAGISRDVYYTWHRRGRAYDEHLAEGGAVVEGEDGYRLMWLNVRAAKARGRINSAATIVELQNPKYPPMVRLRAATWFLERTDPKQWALRHIPQGIEFPTLDEEDADELVALDFTEIEVDLVQSLAPFLEQVRAGGPPGVIDANSTEVSAPAVEDEPGDS